MMERGIIKTIFLIGVFCFSAPLVQNLRGQQQLKGIDSLSFEVIMTDRMFSDLNPGTRFISSLDISPDRLIVLSSPDQYYLLGWGGIVPLGKRCDREIQSFAYTPDGLLLTVSGNELCSFDSQGALSVMFRLPMKGMGITSGKDVMYLFGTSTAQKSHPLYVMARGGKYLKLLDAPDPISAVAETDDAVLFAAGNKLYSVNPSTRELRLLFTEENNKRILSVTYDRSNEIAYFSTANRIFAARGANLGIVSEKAGGVIKYYNGLIVFDPSSRLVMRILGLEEALVVKPTPAVRVPSQPAQESPAAQVSTAAQASPSAQVSATGQPALAAQETVHAPSDQHAAAKPAGDIAAVNVLTNESVVSLVENGLSDNIIITLVRRAKVDFNLTTDAVIDLSARGVSPAVIMEMRQAMKHQTSEMQNK